MVPADRAVDRASATGQQIGSGWTSDSGIKLPGRAQQTVAIRFDVETAAGHSPQPEVAAKELQHSWPFFRPEASHAGKTHVTAERFLSEGYFSTDACKVPEYSDDVGCNTRIITEGVAAAGFSDGFPEAGRSARDCKEMSI